MTSLKRLLLTFVILGCTATVWAADTDPYIGYAYPAGGQQGATFQVTVAGQRLKNVTQVFITGEGVHATVVGFEPANGPLNKLQQDELRRRLQEIRDTRLGRQGGGNKRAMKANKAKTKTEPVPGDLTTPDVVPTVNVVLPDIPELRNLEQQSSMQLLALADRFLNPQKRPKPPIAEQVFIQVTMDPNAAPGDREIRLQTATGLSNPLIFQVGGIPEVRGGGRNEDLSTVAPVQTPVVLNGQIMPGEVDKWPIQLKAKQKLVVAAQARKLIPYLADAVPGWFQSVVSVRDPNGKELAYDDDCGFVVDPALVFTVPSDGQYTLEIHDALYRGREDFVYRIDIGEETTISPLFLLGSRGGIPVSATHTDWKLCAKMAAEHFQLDTDPIPASEEKEPNDTGQTSMQIKLPRIVSGCISKPGDKDVFSIEGNAGDTIVAEVFARRMGSPLDSLVRLIDTTGRVVAWNDDCNDPEAGLFTHHADSYLLAKLPATGRYFVQISDAEAHGGPEYHYYLRVSPPRPDFSLRATPSCLNLTSGRATVATVCAVRKDGWDGDIEIALKDAPAGFSLSGAVIPKGRDHIRMTVRATLTGSGQSNQPMVLQFEGRAQIEGKTVTRPAVPADDKMQAFAYHHLVPTGQLLATVRRGYGASPVLDMAGSDRLKIPAGGSAQVSFTMRSMPDSPVRLELSDPPAGVTLQNVAETARGYTLTFKADDKHVGYTDNLIVEALAQAKTGAKTGPMAQQTLSIALPAIPFEIVKR